MKEGYLVTIKKMAAVENPDVPTSKWGDYMVGSGKNVNSIPVAYWVEGTLLSDIEVGAQMRLARTTRNGHPALGYFVSSRVVSIIPLQVGITEVKTRNSVYHVIGI